MLSYAERNTSVIYPITDIKEDGIISKSEIAAYLLKHLRAFRADEEFGFFLAVTKLISIGRGHRICSSHILFPVKYQCRTFLPQKGDVMIGTVYRVTRTGVFIKCGPLMLIYLSLQLMPDYTYVEGEKSFFLSTDHSRIELNSAVRYKVFGARWRPVETTRQLMVLANIGEASLGPIQSAGSDAVDFESLCPD